MGQLSVLFKTSNYIVSMSPAESYLDLLMKNFL